MTPPTQYARKIPCAMSLFGESRATSLWYACARLSFTLLTSLVPDMQPIRRTADALRAGRIVICDRCTDCLREMELYVWDLAAGGDRVVKKNDHAMDDMRYFVTGVLGSGTAFAVWAPERKI